MDKWMEIFCFIGLLFLSSRRGMLLSAQVTQLVNCLARVVNINLLLYTDLGVLLLSVQRSRPDFRKKGDIAVSWFGEPRLWQIFLDNSERQGGAVACFWFLCVWQLSTTCTGEWRVSETNTAEAMRASYFCSSDETVFNCLVTVS